MMRPIDHHVAFNAVPVHGSQHSSDQASLMYRQIQSFADARDENLKRPERVAEAAGRSGVLFRASEEKIAKAKEKSEKKEMHTYAPGGAGKGRRNVPLHETGKHFDAVA